MPRAGFGQGEDYSGLFASLFQQDLNNRERLDREAESRNKERQAAKDAEMFSKFQNGELSGADLLSYIRGRVADTKGDPTEHEKWTDALRQYSNSIADQAAEDAYANGGSVHDLIAYYRQRKVGLAAGTPEYSDINKRLNQVIDEAQQHDLFLGAQSIQDKIDRGQATLEDLDKFLKGQLRGLRPGSPGRDQLLQQINTVQDNINTRNINTSVAQLDFKLSAGQITATEYNNQIRNIANPFQASDPSFYYSLLSKGQNAIDNFQQTAFDSSAFNDLGYNRPPGSTTPGGTTPGRPGSGVFHQPDPGEFGPATTGDIKFVSQFDGSEFAKVNCVFASGAMLAQAMGVSDLSGGDLRWLSGDTSGGSNYSRLMKALKGVGLSADYAQGIGFNDFIARIKSGTPATIGGLDARLPDALHGAYMGKHSIYVDSYDPKKGFLVYDPATHKPRWWSEEVLRAFSWGGGNNPNALFAPPSSVTPNRTPPANVSIFDKPKRSNTPPNYGVGNTPGVEDHVRATLNNTNTNPAPRTSPEGHPIPYGQTIPTTQDEAKADINVIDAMQRRAIDMASALEQGQTTFVDGTPLNDAVVRDAFNDAYGAGKWRGFLAHGLTGPDAASAFQDNLNMTAELGVRMLNYGDSQQTQIFNDLIAKTDGIFAHANDNFADPAQSTSAITQALASLHLFADKLDPGQPTGEEAVTGTFKDQVDAVIKAADTAADPNASPADVQTAMSAIDPAYRGIVSGIQGTTQAAKGIADGTLAITVVPDPKTGRLGYSAVPARQDTLPNGETISIPNLPGVTRSQMAPVAIMVNNQPTVIFVKYDLSPVPGLNQLTVTDASVVNTILSAHGKPLLDTTYKGVLPPAMLANLTTSDIQRLMVNGVGLDEMPVLAPSVTVPSYLSGGTTVPATTYYQDQATGTWTKDKLPVTSVIPDGFGGVKIKVDTDGSFQPDFVHVPGSGVSVIDATGAPVAMQDFANNGGTDPFNSNVWRDANGVVTTDPSTAIIPNRSLLYADTRPGFNPNASSYIAPSTMDPMGALPAAPSVSVPAPSQGTNIWGQPNSTVIPDPNSPAGGNNPLNNLLQQLGQWINPPAAKASGYTPPAAPTPTVNAQTGFNPNATSYIAPKIKVAYTPPPPPAPSTGGTGFNPNATGYIAPPAPKPSYTPPAPAPWHAPGGGQ